MRISRDIPSQLSFPARPAIAILGVPFDNVNKTKAIELMEGMIGSGLPHYVVTPNVDFLVQAREDIELRRILFDAHLVLCDGAPLVWASRLLGNPLPERVAGADMVPLLIDAADKKGYRIFLLGATTESATQAVSNLRAKYPRLIIAGHYSPPFAPLLEMDHEEIKKRIAEAQPDVLFVSFGCPKQEKWISMNYQTLGVPVVAGVGATIDFLGGRMKRAPVWMQRTGTEWLFRLAQEPRRLFRRYLKDLWIFGGSILTQWWRLRASSHRKMREETCKASDDKDAVQSTNFSSGAKGSFQYLRLPERLDLTAVSSGALLGNQVLEGARHWLLDVSSVKFIDSTGVGFLIQMQKKLRSLGRQMILVAPGPNVQRAIGLMRLERFFISAPSVEAAKMLLQDYIHKGRKPVTRPLLDGGETIAWHDEITAENAELVWEQTRDELSTRSESSEWTIDLQDVGFIDSTGLAVMVRLQKLARRECKALYFRRLQHAVCNVVRTADLVEFLLHSKPHEMRPN